MPLISSGGGARRKSRRPVTQQAKALTHKTKAQAERAIATQVVKTDRKLKKVARLVHAEKRYKDIAPGAVNMLNTGTVTLLNGMQIGDQDGNREGTTLAMTYLAVKGQFYSVGGAVANGRLMIVYDKQTNAAAPVVNDVLTACEPNTFRNNNTMKRFIVLYDKSVSISGGNTYPKRFDFGIPLKKNTQFNTSNAGTVGDIVTGGLFAIWLSDLAASYPTIDFHARLFYGA